MRLTKRRRREICVLYRRGVPVTRIMQRLGCSHGTVYATIRGLVPQLRLQRYARALRRVRRLSAAARGWIAGILDGEGYIGLVPQHRATRQWLTPRCDVTSTTPAMQRQLLRLLGGHVGPPSKRQLAYNRARNCRPQWRWSLWALEKVGALLEAILPLLVVKRRVAAVVLRYCRRRLTNPYKATTWADVRDLACVRHLNKKGAR